MTPLPRMYDDFYKAMMRKQDFLLLFGSRKRRVRVCRQTARDGGIIIAVGRFQALIDGSKNERTNGEGRERRKISCLLSDLMLPPIHTDGVKCLDIPSSKQPHIHRKVKQENLSQYFCPEKKTSPLAETVAYIICKERAARLCAPSMVATDRNGRTCVGAIAVI